MVREIIKGGYYYLAERSAPSAPLGELNRIIKITDIAFKANPKVVWGDIIDVQTREIKKKVREFAYLLRDEISKEDIDVIKKAIDIPDLCNF